jgi:hypothetical protein
MVKMLCRQGFQSEMVLNSQMQEMGSRLRLYASSKFLTLVIAEGFQRLYHTLISPNERPEAWGTRDMKEATAAFQGAASSAQSWTIICFINRSCKPCL